MGKDPAILLYTADLRQGTITFSDAEVGQYVRLLCDQHQTGHLPEHHILKMCGSRDSSVWGKFVKDEEGLWYNVRMQKEVDRRKAYSDSRRKNRLSKHVNGDMKQDVSNHMSSHMDTDTDTKTKTGTGNLLKHDISIRSAKFAEEVQGYQGTYQDEVLSRFYTYWKEPTRNKKYMKFELQETWDTGGRLESWANREKNNGSAPISFQEQENQERLRGKLAAEESRREREQSSSRG